MTICCKDYFFSIELSLPSDKDQMTVFVYVCLLSSIYLQATLFTILPLFLSQILLRYSWHTDLYVFRYTA